MKKQLITLAKYNVWANAKIIGWLKQLSEQQLHENINSSFNSVYATAIHILGAEDVWYCRLNNKPTLWLPDNFKGSALEFFELWQQTSEQLLNAIENFDAEKLETFLKFNRLNGDALELKNESIFLHVFNHSSYHRGQLVTMLRQVNFTAISSLDYFTFCLQ